MLAARKLARGRRRPASAACPWLGGAAGAADRRSIIVASPLRLEPPRSPGVAGDGRALGIGSLTYLADWPLFAEPACLTRRDGVITVLLCGAHAALSWLLTHIASGLIGPLSRLDSADSSLPLCLELDPECVSPGSLSGRRGGRRG